MWGCSWRWGRAGGRGAGGLARGGRLPDWRMAAAAGLVPPVDGLLAPAAAAMLGEELVAEAVAGAAVGAASGVVPVAGAPVAGPAPHGVAAAELLDVRAGGGEVAGGSAFVAGERHRKFSSRVRVTVRTVSTLS